LAAKQGSNPSRGRRGGANSRRVEESASARKIRRIAPLYTVNYYHRFFLVLPRCFGLLNICSRRAEVAAHNKADVGIWVTYKEASTSTTDTGNQLFPKSMQSPLLSPLFILA
jgi:hypothetical protein